MSPRTHRPGGQIFLRHQQPFCLGLVYELAENLRVKCGLAKPPRTRTVGNKAQISVLTYRFINILTNYLRKVQKFAFAGLFSKPICQTCAQRALMGSGGSKQAGTGLWIAK